MTRQKTIEKNLRKALLEDGPLALALFEYELQEHIAEYLQSKRDDGDDYFFAVTEHTNDVAMLLIDNQEAIYINEAARARLKALWQTSYAGNMRRLIPDMAGELDNGDLYVVGVTITQATG